ncbi:MAG TPA: hypothetical protein VIK91_09260 [Nannocystis sp.]
MARRGPRPALALLAASLLCGTCFHGQALWGEPCAGPGDCGPELVCHEDGVCADTRMCGELVVELADLRPQVALLLDHSGSMRRCLDDPESDAACIGEALGPSRWEALGNLVEAIVGDFAARVDFSATVFPTASTGVGNDPCRLNDSTRIPFGAPDAAARILDAVRLDPDNPPSGENPVREAWAGLFPTEDGGLVRRRAIVLITDNPPNCRLGATAEGIAEELDPEVAALVARSFSEGVLTIVVAIHVVDALAPILAGDSRIDDVNPHAYFSALALAGGAAQDGPEPYLHLAGTQAQEAVLAGLRARLDALTADHDACRVRLPESQIFPPDRVAVELDGRLHRPDPECADDLAWHYLGDDDHTLELCPRACERLRAGSRARIRFGCP